MKEDGQVILILILVMAVALSIGLSFVQKSLVDVSTSSKVEQSSRAYSAAEAGIEKALSIGSGSTTSVDFTNNQSQAQVTGIGLIPCLPGSAGCVGAGQQQDALEFPPLAKEDVAQVWLADPESNLPNCGPGKVCYSQNTLDVYWGNSPTDKAAIEITLIFHDGSDYKPRKWYLDQIDRSNGFCQISTSIDSNCDGGNTVNNYQCKIRLGSNNVSCLNSASIDTTPLQSTSPNRLILVRVRLLYNTTSQPFAVRSVGNCGNDCSLPPQARSLTSIGVSGETQRKVNLFQLYKVVPHYFNYAIFSAGEIAK